MQQPQSPNNAEWLYEGGHDKLANGAAISLIFQSLVSLTSDFFKFGINRVFPKAGILFVHHLRGFYTIISIWKVAFYLHFDKCHRRS